MKTAIDVSDLPKIGFGNRAVTWWGTVGMICIEGTMFALLIGSYLYLKGRMSHWPPDVPPPLLLWGTLNTVILAVSAIPNQLAKKAAERMDVPAVQLWLSVCVVFGVSFSIVRIFEFRALNVWWDQNAYGSLLWALLGFHTAHVLTDLIDTIVLTVLMFVGPITESQFVDVAENSFYWYFVLGLWVPVYALVYLVPRIG
jgi:heme/copper-type cytochrome/quinol oxidase subunit 3